MAQCVLMHGPGVRTAFDPLAHENADQEPLEPLEGAGGHYRSRANAGLAESTSKAQPQPTRGRARVVTEVMTEVKSREVGGAIA